LSLDISLAAGNFQAVRPVLRLLLAVFREHPGQGLDVRPMSFLSVENYTLSHRWIFIKAARKNSLWDSKDGTVSINSVDPNGQSVATEVVVAPIIHGALVLLLPRFQTAPDRRVVFVKPGLEQVFMGKDSREQERNKIKQYPYVGSSYFFQTHDILISVWDNEGHCAVKDPKRNAKRQLAEKLLLFADLGPLNQTRREFISRNENGPKQERKKNERDVFHEKLLLRLF